MSTLFEIELAGEDTLLLVFSNTMNDDIFNLVQQASCLIKNELSEHIIDFIASYASILIHFDLLKVDHFQLKTLIRQTLRQLTTHPQKTGNLIEIPVYYSLESGPDLPRIASHSKLTIEEVILAHQQHIYKVFAIGFAPGFAYLGEVNSKIATPRLNTPRLNVPKGAVAIADQQTAIYPNKSPGGWNIIGLTTFELFDPKSTPHMPFQVGDHIQFKSISKHTFLEMGGELNVDF